MEMQLDWDLVVEDARLLVANAPEHKNLSVNEAHKLERLVVLAINAGIAEHEISDLLHKKNSSALARRVKLLMN